jgi:hypothetical protein
MADVTSMAWMNTPYPPDNIYDDVIPWNLFPPLAHHKLTGEIPVVVHLNDDLHKSLLEEWWGEPWFSSPRQQFRDVVRRRVQNSTLRFEEEGGFRTEALRSVCGEYLDIW